MFDHRSVLISATCIALLALSTCGKDSPTKPSPTQQVPASISITPSSVTLDAIGKTAQLTARLLDENNRAITGQNVVWSSNSPSVATVDNSGLVRAVSAGTARISATSGGVQAQVVVTVVVGKQIPARIVVTPEMALLEFLGATVKASAEVRDQQNRVITDIAVSWSSNDSTVAVVDSTGLVTARGKGMARITAGIENITGSMVVTVMQQVYTITLEPAMATMIPGDTLRITTEARDAQGAVIDGAVFNWSSDDESVATVNTEGLVLARGSGTAQITAAVAGKSSSVRVTVGENPDRRVLAVLYNATGGPDWTNNQGWMTNEPLANWANVKIDPNTRRVAELDLGNNNLNGSIPGELGDLGNLETLRLNNNSLSGEIPSELGNLSKLTTLQLNNNNLHGSIPPELSVLKNLRSLQLGWNSLTGKIPQEFGNLAGLQLLDIGSNQISGSIPLKLGALTSLRTLILAVNQLTGSIPDELGGLTDLQTLSLHSNKLSGNIPPELGDLTELRTLRLEENEFTGDIPHTLGELVNLEWLDLRDNDLSGRLPSSLGNLKFLQKLHLFDNNLAGDIPPELGNLSNLQNLQLGRNDLSGEIPPELGNLRYLVLFDVGTNRLSGGIPPELSYLEQLEHLFLAENKLTGSIPPELGALGNLQQLFLHENLLSGPIPAELAGSSDLRLLRVGNNQLTGTLPAELGSLRNLSALYLSGNKLSGEIPSQLTNLKNLSDLYAFDTSLCIPAEATFQDWLREIPNKEIANCETVRHTLRISPDSADLIVGESVQFIATVSDTDGRIIGDVSISWESSDNAVASVSADGLVTAHMNGTATLTALTERVTVQVKLIVGPRPVPTTIEVSPSTVELHAVGASARLTAVVYDQAGQTMHDITISWTSDNAAVATVDDLGRVVAVGEGRATVTATAGSATRSVNVTVMQQIHAITLSTERAFLSIGDTLRIKAAVVDELGSLVAGAEIDWSSDDASVATADAEGLVLAVGAGTAEITAAVEDYSAHAQVTVNEDTDREVLVALFNATNGPAWKENSGWLTNEPLDSWHNVTTNPNNGRVVTLDLAGNGLDGRIPPELGSLTELVLLDLSGNSLYGEVPSELGNLNNLQAMRMISNNLVGELPPALGELPDLTYMDFSTNNLWGEIPSELGNLLNLQILVLEYNEFIGEIPPELGNLKNVHTMQLNDNRLSGEIPVELGDLEKLKILQLGWNGLSGTVPPEFSNLAEIQILDLGTNQLSGEVPSELGGLGNLQDLILAKNRLTGTIPPELGNLRDLELLSLHDNELSGVIPSELGKLNELQVLRIERNELTGRIPPELGNLTNLERLDLYENQLSGELPLELADLTNLDQVVFFGTQLCAPLDAEIQDWLDGLEHSRIANCEAVYSTDGVIAYLTQAAQSIAYPVPLLADEPALLRVFVTSERDLDIGMPAVRATFFHNGSLVHTADIPSQNVNIPRKINEGDLMDSANAEVPASIVKPGLEMVLEINPEGTLESTSGVGRRIPETGRTTVQVVEVPPLNLMIIPFLWNEDPDYSVVTVTDGLSADHELLNQTRDNLPIVDFNLIIHEPVFTSINPTEDNVVALINETEMIRTIEGGTEYYMGTITGVLGGFAWLDGNSSVAPLTGSVIAHELGHNLSLRHAPCGGAGQADRYFPYRNGEIGVWGFNHRTGTLVPPDTPDLMGYCGHPDEVWISDYFFNQALQHRQSKVAEILAAGPSSTKSLLLSGGVDAEGNLKLDPAFVVDASPNLPLSGGSYRLTGKDASDRSIFELSFTMGKISHAPEVSFFTFALPVDFEWANRLHSVTLSGPEGEVSIGSDGDQASVLMLDYATGQVRGILRNLPTHDQELTAARRLTPEPGLDVLISRGLPGMADWRR